MLGGMQIEQKLNQSPLQSRSQPGIEEKSAPGKLRSPLEIDQTQSLTEFHMRLGLEVK